MAPCEKCELLKQGLCPGVGRGAFCTKITDSEYMDRHPAIVDFQGPVSCEVTAFYERPALDGARARNTSE